MIAEAVERGDLDELTRLVEALCSNRQWDDLLVMRDLCMRALERGKQLWPAAHFAEYRLALEATPEVAARVLVEGSGAFALGPISEVAALTHTWKSLAPHIPSGAVGALTAHERVVRGEDLSGVVLVPDVLELPLRLAPWEPRYALAAYRSDGADFPAAPIPRLEPIALRAVSSDISLVGDRSAERARRGLLDLAQAWSVGSDGRAEAVAVAGSAFDAIAALGVRDARVARCDGADAVAHMAWTAASGGAFGRRRGAATGRLDAWLAVGALGGLGDVWPLPVEEMGEVLDRLSWYHWDANEPVTGWSLRIAVHDPATNRAWSIAAVDAR